MRESFESYIAAEGVNWSSLKHLDVSPLTYRYNKDHDRPDTMALKAGRYAHAALFEPDTIGAEYVVYYGEGDRKTKEYKTFAAAHPGMVIFKADEFANLNAMVDAVRAHPLVADYLAAPDGQYETSLRWVDEETRLPCKGRIDWLIPSMRTVIDFKTMRSVEMRAVVNAIKRYGYDGQSAHYSNGVKAALGWDVEHYVLICVEKVAPYEVLVMPYGQEIRELAQTHVRELMGRLKFCMDANEWPGRYTEPMPLARETSGVPTWIFGGDDDTIIFDSEE